MSLPGLQVAASQDLWDDEQEKIIVLKGTTGNIVGYDEAIDDSPFVFHVEFADGTTTLCTPDELIKLDPRKWEEIP